MQLLLQQRRVHQHPGVERERSLRRPHDGGRRCILLLLLRSRCAGSSTAATRCRMAVALHQLTEIHAVVVACTLLR